MKLSTLVIEIRRRSSSIPPTFCTDPMHEIHERCRTDPGTIENRVLLRVARAINEGRGDFDDTVMWTLGKESLGLLNALIERRASPF